MVDWPRLLDVAASIPPAAEIAVGGTPSTTSIGILLRHSGLRFLFQVEAPA